MTHAPARRWSVVLAMKDLWIRHLLGQNARKLPTIHITLCGRHPLPHCWTPVHLTVQGDSSKDYQVMGVIQPMLTVALTCGAQIFLGEGSLS